MGTCRYCNQNAGLLREEHGSCVKEANQRLESIENCMAYAVIHGISYSEVSAMVEKRTTNFNIPYDQIRSALKNGWNKGAEQRSIAQPISPVEFNEIDELYREAGFREDEKLALTGTWAEFFSYRIWTLLHDQIEPYQGPISFNLPAGETAFYGIANVLVSERRLMSSYVGGYGGVSVRVASGIYYHLGGVRGHKEEHASVQELDYGDFLMTTRAAYFGGTEKGITFRLPYNSILRFVPYADGVGICRDGGREQIFSPQHPANSGWWLFNMLQALASKESATRS